MAAYCYNLSNQKAEARKPEIRGQLKKKKERKRRMREENRELRKKTKGKIKI